MSKKEKSEKAEKAEVVDTHAGIERAALVAAAKDMNETLELDPPISFKGDEGKLGAKAIAEAIIREGKGWNGETEKFESDLAVTRDDKLKAETFNVLETLGVLPKAKAKAKADLAGDVGKGSVERTGKSRGATKRFTDTASLLAGLKNIKPDDKAQSAALRMDALLLKGYTIKKLNEICAENGLPNIVPHAMFRLSRGYIIEDTRTTSRDESGRLTLTGYDPKKVGAVSKVPKAEKAEKAKKVKADLAADAAAEKVERTGKKAKKTKKVVEADEDEE